MAAISDPNKIALFKLCTLRSALKLEIKGMRCAGRSAYSILKTDYGYRGTRAVVLAAVIADIETTLATMEQSCSTVH
jgi:hypothetical protein